MSFPKRGFLLSVVYVLFQTNNVNAVIELNQKSKIASTNDTRNKIVVSQTTNNIDNQKNKQLNVIKKEDNRLSTNNNKTNPTQTTQKVATKTQNNNHTAEKTKVHVVKADENIYRISLKYKVKQDDIIKLNNIRNNFIFQGQKLKLPEYATMPDDTFNENDNQKQQTSVISNNKQTAQSENGKEKKEPIQQDIIHQSTFIWPTRGAITSRFGAINKNVRLDGVTIATEMSAIVRASSSGIISYNNIVDGYDNVVLIKHYNGFFTAYGHVDSIVSVGDKVLKGQIIGYVKPSMNSKRSMLYFSIRKQNKSYDPEKIIQTKINN